MKRLVPLMAFTLAFAACGDATSPAEGLPGTWSAGTETVTLTTADGPSVWTVEFSGDEVLLTLDETQPANTIRLRRA